MSARSHVAASVAQNSKHATMNEPVKKKRALAPRKKAPATNTKELEKNNLNVSGGRLFYERAASRRSRHRDALKNREIVSS